MEYRLTFAALSGFLITFLVIPSIVNVSNARKLFDEPNQRRLNKVVIPTMGGIAIFIGFTISSILFLEKGSPHELRYLFAAMIMMLFIGIKDDILVIAPSKKLLVQLAAALILVLPGNFRIVHPQGLFSAETLNAWINIPLSVLIILFLINALNLIDGIDGLAGGLSLLASLALGGWFLLAGDMNSAILCLSFSGSLVAFLCFNLRGGKNKIFMGDTGSLILGVFFAAMIIRFNELNFFSTGPYRFSQAPLMALALMIVPVTDTLRVFTIRIWHKRSPFSPDMKHFHHLLIKLGMSHIRATCFLLGYTIAFSVLALLFIRYNLNLSFTFPLLLGLSFTTVGLIYARTKQRVRFRIIMNNRNFQPGSVIPQKHKAKPAIMNKKLQEGADEPKVAVSGNPFIKSPVRKKPLKALAGE